MQHIVERIELYTYAVFRIRSDPYHLAGSRSPSDPDPDPLVGSGTGSTIPGSGSADPHQNEAISNFYTCKIVHVGRE